MRNFFVLLWWLLAKVKSLDHQLQNKANLLGSKNADPLAWCQQLVDKNLKLSCESELKIWCKVQQSGLVMAPAFCHQLLATTTTAAPSVLTALPTIDRLISHKTKAVNNYKTMQLKLAFSRLLEGQNLNRAPVLKSKLVLPKSVNRSTADDVAAANFFMGDIRLTDTQWTMLITYANETSQQQRRRRRRRKVGEEPVFKKWNNTIPFYLDRQLRAESRKAILSAIQLWQESTCLKFYQLPTGDNRSGSGILFTDTGPFCYGFVGEVGAYQELSVAWPKCAKTGIVAHLIGHALGLLHEQNRPESQQHLWIRRAELEQKYHDQFVTLNSELLIDFHLPYDHGSLMHSGQVLDRQREATILTKDPNYQWTIGQVEAPSFLDYKLINLVYCSDRCTEHKALQCLHDGYEDVNDCQTCTCPTGFGGDQCERAEMEDGSDLCGGELKVSRALSAHLRTPNDGAEKCSWLLYADDKQAKIKLFIEDLQMPCDELACSTMYIELKLGPHFDTTGYRFCCNQSLTSRQFESYANEALVIYKSKSHKSGAFSIRYGLAESEEPVDATDSCPCNSWSSWSECSQKCGGCGMQTRKRTCSTLSVTDLINCTSAETKRCNFEKCEGSKVIWNNGEFHLLFNGCCVGLQLHDGVCQQSRPINAILNTLLGLGQ